MVGHAEIGGIRWKKFKRSVLDVAKECYGFVKAVNNNRWRIESWTDELRKCIGEKEVSKFKYDKGL